MLFLNPRNVLTLVFTFLLTAVLAGAQAPSPSPTPSSTPSPSPTPRIAEEDQVVKVNSRLVVVPVSVTDGAGQPVQGLKLEDFRIAEDGRNQTLDNVGAADQVPLEIALLIDVSGSVDPLFEFEKSAAGQFLKSVMKPEDHATIFLIGEKPVTLAASQNSTQAAETLKTVMPAGKFTAFYDSITAATTFLRKNAPVRSRRVIVALTDGEDNWSDMTQQAEMATWRDVDVNTLTPAKRDQLAAATDAAHQKAQAKIVKDIQNADTVFYSINPAGGSFRLNKISIRAQNGMGRFANETGGTSFLPAFLPTDTKDTLQNASNGRKNEAILENIFRQLANELRAQYLVQYYSDADFPKNKYVKLDVRVNRAAGVKIRARQGYFVKE